MTIQAFAAPKSKSSLEKFAYEPEALGEYDIEVRISHCGICHSDLHLIDNDWGVSVYPLVPGHEIIGSVTQTGALVQHLNRGDRVGIGWQRYACHTCPECANTNDNYCPAKQATCVAHHGGFAESIRIDSRYAFPIPESLDSAGAAPLLCGGATVFTPLKRFNAKPGQRIGVIGIGGLGHLAIRFARAFGCEVTAFSQSPDKEAEAKSFGAHHFVSSTDRRQITALGKSFDMILSTVFSDLNWDSFIRLLKIDGTLCFLGVPPSKVEIPVGFLMDGRRKITSSSIGSRSDIISMLDFAALHGITAQTEVLPLIEVNAALDRLRQNKPRYRMVLKM